MNSVPFLYVNLTALCCFCLMFITFLAAKKTPEIRAFIVMIFGFICWTGGSIFMRLQVFPGINFWFYVSIIALFSLALLIFFFVCSFARVKGSFLKIVWTISTLIILVLTALGVFLKPPTAVSVEGGTVFMYDMSWPIVIPCAFFLLIVMSIIKILRDMVKEKGTKSPGLRAIILGCVAVTIGNMVQIIPGNVFPWDTLSGIVFAALLIESMYMKRMFRMTLIISRSLLLLASGVICILVSSFFVIPLTGRVNANLAVTETAATTIVIFIYTIFMALTYFLLKKLIDRLFARDGQQGHLINNFSNSVTRSLNTKEIMVKMVEVIKSEIPVEKVYVCLQEDRGFVAKYSSEPLSSKSFIINKHSPWVSFFNNQEETYFIPREFKLTPLSLSMWDSEKNLLRGLDLGCVIPLRDEDRVIGLILLSNKEKSTRFNYLELSFLTAISSIASIAIKNADLYERMYKEARIDSLTTVYNYRYFIEKIESDFEACRNDCLALLYINVDDFTLYNHLYGAAEGDKALRNIAELISVCVGDSGTVFRCSGKVFAVLLPNYDVRRADILAHEIQRKIVNLNNTPDRNHMKPLSVSGGICVSPYAASSPKELMENADLAVYRSKNSGKNNISIFKGILPVSQQISEKAREIVEQTTNRDVGDSNSATIFALTAAIDAKDHYTYRHSRNVALYSSILATAAGLSTDQVRMVYDAALLHDIGKISIPEHILSKRGRLTDDEFNIMKGHVNNSIEMIRHLPLMDYLIPAAVSHHERWDGKGYPRGIAGEEIPVAARCLAIADAFDAMTSNRAYRKSFSVDYAADEIKKNAGSQFDPALAGIFINLIQAGEITVGVQ